MNNDIDNVFKHELSEKLIKAMPKQVLQNIMKVN